MTAYDSTHLETDASPTDCTRYEPTHIPDDDAVVYESRTDLSGGE